MSRDYILGEEREFSALMKLSIPATIAMLVNAIYNIVDTMFIGKGVGELALAGLSIYLPIQMIIMSMSLLVGIGSASVFSRKLGAKDREGADKVVGNLTFIMAVFSVILASTGLIFSDQIVTLFGASKEVLPFASEYARAMFLGVYVFPFSVASNNIIRAEGHAKNAMHAMIYGMFLNIFLDYLFIYVFDWGIWGAGLATSISKAFSFLYITIYYFGRVSSINFKLKNMKFDLAISKEMFMVGSSAFITQAAMSFVAVLLNYSLLKYGGNQAVSIYSIVYKLTLFVLMPLIGIVQGMQPIIGYSRGANNHTRIRNTVKMSLLTSTAIACVLTLLMWIVPELIVGLFTDSKDLIVEGSKVLRIIVMVFPLIGCYQIAVGYYQSIGQGKASLFLSLLRQIIFFIPLAIALPYVANLGILGIWLAFPIADALTILVTGVFVKSRIDK